MQNLRVAALIAPALVGQTVVVIAGSELGAR
jgi:hypothetical protein